MIRKWDVVLIVTLLILSCIPAGIFWASGELTDRSGTYAIISVDGEEYKTIPLSAHHGTDTLTLHAHGGYNTVVIQDQAIAITDADCPDQLCVKEGFLSKPGQTSVCLPHKVMIEVRADDDSAPDIIRAR